jgi:hypothetical protein
LDAQIQVAFHLTGQSDSNRGALTRGDQGDGEKNRCDGTPQQRRQQLVGILYLRHLKEAIFAERCGSQNQDCRIDEKSQVERHHLVEDVVPDGLSDGFGMATKLSGLHQRGVQIKVVGHHRGANDADGDVQSRRARQRGNEPKGQFAKIRLGKEHFLQKTTAYNNDQTQDERLHLADAVAN